MRYEAGESGAPDVEPSTLGGAKPHTSDNPMMVMVDESNGNKYMRSVDHKGLGGDGDNSWLIKDMHEELKAWGTLVAHKTPSS